MIAKPLAVHDVVQFHPSAPHGFAGNLAIVVARGDGDTYTLESLQSGRLAVLERVPGSSLTLIGRAAFARTSGGTWTTLTVVRT